MFFLWSHPRNMRVAMTFGEINIWSTDLTPEQTLVKHSGKGINQKSLPVTANLSFNRNLIISIEAHLC